MSECQGGLAAPAWMGKQGELSSGRGCQRRSRTFQSLQHRGTITPKFSSGYSMGLSIIFQLVLAMSPSPVH